MTCLTASFLASHFDNNTSPLSSIKTPLANFNPFNRRPCVGGTQSLKRQTDQQHQQLLSRLPFQQQTTNDSMSSGIGTASDLSFNDSSIQDLLSNLNNEQQHQQHNKVNNKVNEFNASMTASSTTNSILNSILRENLDLTNNLALDENLASMSKYVEELTGCSRSTIDRSSINNNNNNKQKMLSNLYQNGSAATREIIQRVLLNSNQQPINGNHNLLSPQSDTSSTNRQQQQQIFNFSPQSPTNGSTNKLLKSTTIPINDANIFNSLTSLSPQAVANLLRNYDANTNGNSLLQTLDWLNSLQLNLMKETNVNDISADLTNFNLINTDGQLQSMFNNNNKMMTMPGNEIEMAATSYRNSAITVAQRSEAAFHWSGKLPSRNYNSMTFSRKVFLGGVPWDATSEAIMHAFCTFGPLTVIWPQRENQNANFGSRLQNGPKGYCYLIFDHEQSVSQLLANCYRDPTNGGDYYRIMSPKMVTKDVQVIPWVISDSQYRKQGTHRLENTRTVFIGALHGMITAEALATIMNDLFNNVIFAAIDTDKYKYPIGSGRVVFSNQRSYVRAVTANFVEVRTAKFSKTIQIDPYLEDSTCSKCQLMPGLYFCRSFECFSYFCPNCWQRWHNSMETLYNHKPLRRSSRQHNTTNELINF